MTEEERKYWIKTQCHCGVDNTAYLTNKETKEKIVCIGCDSIFEISLKEIEIYEYKKTKVINHE